MARSHSKRSYPSLAFFSGSSSSSSYAMDIPLKATPSPPSCSSSSSFTSPSDSDFLVRSTSSSLSSSPSSSISSSAGSFNSVSHPDWPQSDTLSSQEPVTSQGGCQKSCYISDEDLEDLASLPLWNDVRIPDHYVASGYAGGNAQLTAEAYGDVSSRRQEELPPTSLVVAKPAPRKMKSSSAGGKRRRSRELRRKPLGIMTPISESGE